MSTCAYCGKVRCHHLGPEEDQPASKMSPTGDKPQPETTLNLFALTDRRELLCILCGKVIPTGIDQTYLRAHHGKQHVRAGDAIEDRRGLPEGAVRYLVKVAP